MLKVKDIVSGCEYIGCEVIDQLGNIIKVTKENLEEIYEKPVEHISASNNKVLIWTFDKIDELSGITPQNVNDYIRANPKWDKLMNAVLIKIRKELDRLYWNRNQKEMESPFDNTGAEYSNDTFTVRAYNWNEDEEDIIAKPNFEWGPIRVYWYKHEGRGNTIYAKIGYDDPAIYSHMLNKCIEALKKDFGEDSE